MESGGSSCNINIIIWVGNVGKILLITILFSPINFANSQEQILESLKTYLKLYEHPNDLTLKTNKNSQIFKRYNPLVDHKDYNCIILS